MTDGLSEAYEEKQWDVFCENNELLLENDQLKAENDKLRELVRDMYLCSVETCTDCEYHDYSGEGFWCKRGVGWKRARMRELRIEVCA